MQPDPTPPAPADSGDSPNPDPLAVGLEEAAPRVGLCPEMLRAEVAAGRLPAFRIGRRLLVHLRALDDYLYGQAMQNVKPAEGAESGTRQ